MSEDGRKSAIPAQEPERQLTKEQKEEEDRRLGKDELIQRQKAVENPLNEADKEDDSSDLSEEDKKLKDTLTALVQSIVEPGLEAGVRTLSLNMLSTEIRSSTSSMTAIPKPLKFLRAHYDTLVNFYNSPEAAPVQALLAQILSVLAMVWQKEGARDSLKYRLAGGKQEIGLWGHEYVRHLAAEISAEYDHRLSVSADTADIMAIVDEIIPFNMKHNAETDACDLAMEVDRLELLPQYVTEDNYARVAPYLLACSEYHDQSDREGLLKIAFDCLIKVGQAADALRVALKIGDKEKVSAVFASTEDALVKKQLGFILAQHRYYTTEFDEDAELKDIAGNVHLTKHFQALAQDLDCQEPKTPEDIYKTHLAEGGPSFRRPRQSGSAPKGMDSAKQNLAASFVNAFVNAGYGKDLLILPEKSDWLYKNKEHGQISAAASLGMLMMWDLEIGFSALDKYTYSSIPFIKSGSLLGIGMLSTGVNSEMDAALALLSEHLESSEVGNRISAVYGLGLAYVGTGKEDVMAALVPLVADGSQPIEVCAMACLSLGLVFVGTANDEVGTTIIDAFMERNDTELKDSVARMMCAGLGLLYLGKPDMIEVVTTAISAIEHPIKKFLELSVQTCAYFGSGSVLMVQKLFNLAGEHMETEKDKEDKDKKGDDKDAKGAAKPAAGAGSAAAAANAPASAASATGAAAAPKPNATAAEPKDEASEDEGPSFHPQMHQALAVVGIGLVTMGEELGAQMALRALDHLLQYGDLPVRRAVPIALGLLSVSNPRMTVIDTLAKLSHDNDLEISQNSILALGIVGAGTNNSRIATLLRSLSVYYTKEPNHLFLVRVAQGFLHMGKGLLTINPYHLDSLVYIPSAAAALVALAHTALDMRHSVLSKRHYMLYCIAPAMRPRMLVTLDEELRPVPVKVRVGAAVDTVGQAGKPKSITGFQTHTTPVLLSHGDRAEMATDEFIPLTTILEGVVVVKKNPNATKENE